VISTKVFLGKFYLEGGTTSRSKKNMSGLNPELS